ncbi:hypothetical protein PtoMrB4_51720 [Metapseudomonas otitidis]|uniref:Uncharacterized protein n=1 Tax=Metapseudomonas otitidis TaxID=319939 RepID=A0A679GNX8_9GAMM|nr:hypothetical protein PtoMrB4_51720 [Pseudomonas otitidis]
MVAGTSCKGLSKTTCIDGLACVFGGEAGTAGVKQGAHRGAQAKTRHCEAWCRAAI